MTPGQLMIGISLLLVAAGLGFILYMTAMAILAIQAEAERRHEDNDE